MTAAKEYVLGTGIDELERLAFQHRLWSDAAHAAWRTARIRIGQRILDVGCGPGFASFDLAQLVTRQGQVVGVDESSHFVDYLNQQAQVRGLGHLSARTGDVQHLAEVLSPQESFDLAYARWVLCFVKDPRAVIAGICRAVRPGGRVVIHDYFHYESLTMAPKNTAHDRAVQATRLSWHYRGGNTDVAGHLIGWFAEHGAECTHFQTHARAARGADTMFHWPQIWWQTYAPKLVAMGYLTEQECADLLQAVADVEQDNTRFIQCPTVYEFVFQLPDR